MEIKLRIFIWKHSNHSNFFRTNFRLSTSNKKVMNNISEVVSVLFLVKTGAYWNISNLVIINIEIRLFLWIFISYWIFSIIQKLFWENSPRNPPKWSNISDLDYKWKIENKSYFSYLFSAMALFDNVNLVYGTVSEFCTQSGCPDMTGPGQR